MNQFFKSPVGILIVSFLVLIVLTVGILASSYISAHNYGNRAENQIKAEYTVLKNIHAQYAVKIAELAQVPDMQRDDLKEIVTAAISGRYGENGSQAVFQWIQEDNPKLDPGIYNKIATVIEAGRNKFENAQSRFEDIKRQYQDNLGYFWRGMWLRINGYPKINFDDYKIITSDRTEETFTSGNDTAVKLR